MIGFIFLLFLISPTTAHDYLIFSGLVNNGNIKGVQIYNPTSSSVNMYLYGVYTGHDSQADPISDASGTHELCWDKSVVNNDAASSCMLEAGESMVLSYNSAGNMVLSGLASQVPGNVVDTYSSVTGDDWLVLGKRDRTSDSYSIVDVIGNHLAAASGSPKSYSGTGSGGATISTNNSGIKRRTDLSSIDITRTSWDTSEWTFIETDIVASFPLDYMKYHFADMFECSQDSDCPDEVDSYCRVGVTPKICVDGQKPITSAPTSPTQTPTSAPTQAPTTFPTSAPTLSCYHSSCATNEFCSKGTSTCTSCSECDTPDKANDDKCPTKCSPLMFTAYVEEGNRKALQIFNPNQYAVSIEDYAFFIIQNPDSADGSGSIRSLRRPTSDDERIEIPSGQTAVIASSKAGAKMMSFLPNVNFFQVSSGSFFSFNGNDPVFLAEYKEDADKLASQKDVVKDNEIGVIFDVIGDTASNGKWSSESGDSEFSTENHAIKRKSSTVMTANKGAYDFQSRAVGTRFSWEVTEWEKKLDLAGLTASDADLSFLGYHYQNSLKCSSHDQCPFNPLSQAYDGFCYKDKSCELCSLCTNNDDAFDGTCPDKCPAQCSGLIPKTTCPDCGSSKAFIPLSDTPNLDLASDQPADKLSALVKITWCSSDYEILSPTLTDAASANISLHFFDPNTNEGLYEKVHRVRYPSAVTRAASDSCESGLEYSATLPVSDPYLTIKSSILLYDECQVDSSAQSNHITLDESTPTWFTSQNALTRSSIVPVVAGSTSETAVVQWQEPLLNCASCSITGYNVYMSEDGGAYNAIGEPDTHQTVALLRGLTTGKDYKFKVEAKTSMGTSQKSEASSVFQVSPEKPDAPPLIYFEANKTSPFRAVDAIVVKGEINGALITKYVLKYDVSPFDFVNPEVIILTSASNSDKISTTGATFELSDLKSATAYKFKATATNSVGESQESEEFDCTTAAVTPSEISFVGVLGAKFSLVTVTVQPGEKEDSSLTNCILEYWADGTTVTTTVASSVTNLDKDFVFDLSTLEDATLYHFNASIWNTRNFIQTPPKVSYRTDAMVDTRIRFERDEDRKFSGVAVTVVPGEKDDGVLLSCSVTYYAVQGGESVRITAKAVKNIESNNFELDLMSLEPSTEYCFTAMVENDRGAIQHSFNHQLHNCQFEYKTDAMKETRIEFFPDEFAPFSSVTVVVLPGELDDADLKNATLSVYEKDKPDTRKDITSNNNGSKTVEFEFAGDHGGDHLKSHLVKLKEDTTYCFSVIVFNERGLRQATKDDCKIGLFYKTTQMQLTTIKVAEIEDKPNHFDVTITTGETGNPITNYTLFWGSGNNSNAEDGAGCNFDGVVYTHSNDCKGGRECTFKDDETPIEIDREGTFCFYAEVENDKGVRQVSGGDQIVYEIGLCKEEYYELKSDDERNKPCENNYLELFLKKKEGHENCRTEIFDTYYNESYIKVNCPYSGLESMEGMAVLAISGCGVMICLTAALIFFCLRKKMTIKIAQPTFLITFCVSAACLNFYNILGIPKDSKWSCFGRSLFMHFSWMVYMGVLVVKLYRVYQLFLSKSAHNLKRVKVTAADAIKVILPPIILNFVIICSLQFCFVSQEQDTVDGLIYIIPYEFTSDLSKQTENNKYKEPKYKEPYDKIKVPECPLNQKGFKASGAAGYFNNAPLVVDVMLAIIALVFLAKVKGVSKNLAEKATIGHVVGQSTAAMVVAACVIGPEGVPTKTKDVLFALVILLMTVSSVLSFLIPKVKHGLKYEWDIHPEDLQVKEGLSRHNPTRGLQKEASLVQFNKVGGSSGGLISLDGNRVIGVYHAKKGQKFESSFKKISKTEKGEGIEMSTPKVGRETFMEEKERDSASAFEGKNPIRALSSGKMKEPRMWVL